MHLRSVLLVGFLLAGAATPALASDPRPLQVDDLFALEDVADPRVSPDGLWVAYTVNTLDRRRTSRTRTSTSCRSGAASRFA